MDYSGCTKFVTGGMFIGEHKNHIIDGFGVFITWEGLKFIGHCYDSGTTSNGKWYDKNDNEIDIIKLGYNKFGVKYGRETKISPTGAKYTGTMRNHKPHGFGTKISEDGLTYVGEWKNGKKHGQGTYINQLLGSNGVTKSGRKFVGEFREDKEWNGNIYSK